MIVPSPIQLWHTLGDYLRTTLHGILTLDNRHYAIKTALAAALSFLICRLLDPNYGSWAAVSALFVMQVYVADSLRMSLYRVIGTIIGAAMGYTAVMILPPGLPGMTVGILITAGLAGMLLCLDSRFRLAGLTAVVIIGTLNTTDVLALSLDRVVETVVGIFVSLLISTTLWPISSALKLREGLAQQYTQLTDTLTTLSSAFINQQSKVPPDTLARLHRALTDDYTALRQLQEYDPVNLRRHYGDLPILVDGLNTLRTYMALMLELLNAENGDGVSLDYTDKVRTLTESINSLLRWIGNSRTTPAPTTKIPQLLTEDNPFYPDALHQIPTTSGLNRIKITQALAFCYALNHLASQAETLKNQMLQWQSRIPDTT